MKPLFQEGEDVILQSPVNPQYNGEYVVTKQFFKGDKLTCRITGSALHTNFCTSRVLYQLDSPFLDPSTGVEILVKQSSLKKKHRPSDDSFQEMISTLKRPQKLSQ